MEQEHQLSMTFRTQINPKGYGMSDYNPGMLALRRLNTRYDEQAAQITDFNQRQADGENPDQNEFMRLLDQRSVTQQAMEAQFKLYEKPLKTVMNETK